MLLQFILQHGPLLKGGPLCSFDLNWAPFACSAGFISEAAMSAHERHRSQVRFYPPAALIMGINMLTPLCLCGSWMCCWDWFLPAHLSPRPPAARRHHIRAPRAPIVRHSTEGRRFVCRTQLLRSQVVARHKSRPHLCCCNLYCSTDPYCKVGPYVHLI